MARSLLKKKATPGKKKATAKKQRTPRNVESTSAAPGEYRIGFFVNDQVFDGSGVSVVEAITNAIAGIKPVIIKSRIVVKLAVGENVYERSLWGMQYRRLLNNRIAREILAKRFAEQMR